MVRIAGGWDFNLSCHYYELMTPRPAPVHLRYCALAAVRVCGEQSFVSVTYNPTQRKCRWWYKIIDNNIVNS